MTPTKHSPAFTLLELVIALALLAVVASLTTAALAPRSPAGREHLTLDTLRQHLATARVSAMQRTRPITVTLEQQPADRDNPEHITLTVDQRTRVIDPNGLTLVGHDARPRERMRITFGDTGRTHARRLRFLSPDAGRFRPIDPELLADPAFQPQRPFRPTDDAAAHDGGLADGRLWLLAFDPVSGAPRVRAHGRGLPATLEPQETDENP